MGEHCKEHQHSFTWNNIAVLASEDNTTRRKIREASEIQQSKPSLNRDSGISVPEVYKPLLRQHTSDDTVQAGLAEIKDLRQV